MSVAIEGAAGYETVKVWRRYLLWQVPGWALAAAVLAALHHWLGLPVRVALLLFALYAAKDFILYPFLRRSYEVDPRSQLERLIGETGVVAERLSPLGYVRVRGELWRAQVRPPEVVLEEGNRIKVEAIEGWTLLVRPLNEDPPSGPLLPKPRAQS